MEGKKGGETIAGWCSLAVSPTARFPWKIWRDIIAMGPTRGVKWHIYLTFMELVFNGNFFNLGFLRIHKVMIWDSVLVPYLNNMWFRRIGRCRLVPTFLISKMLLVHVHGNVKKVLFLKIRVIDVKIQVSLIFFLILPTRNVAQSFIHHCFLWR